METAGSAPKGTSFAMAEAARRRTSVEEKRRSSMSSGSAAGSVPRPSSSAR